MTLTPEETLHTELDSGERILWAGRPGKGAFDVGGLTATWFLLGLIGLSFVWILAGNPSRGQSVLATLLAIGGLAALLWVVVVMPKEHSNLIYGVTNRRVIIVHRWLRRRVEAYALIGMAPANVLMRAGDERTGTIGFADFAQRCGYEKRSICMPEFKSIPQPARVIELIRSTIEATRNAGPL
jgi:hypothetical protein